MTRTKFRLFVSLFFFFLVTISLWVGCSPVAPREDVPDLLSTRFKAMYPNAEGESWDIGEGIYIVTFQYSGSKLAVDFLPDGAVERTKLYIDDASLPATALTFLTTTVPGQKINHATKNVDGFGTVTWEVSVDADTYLFATNGVLLGLLPRKPAAKQ